MSRLRAALAATLTVLLLVPSVVATAQTDPAELTAATWSLTSLQGEAVPATAGITATFGADGSVSGSGGCNSYSADYTVEGSTIAITPLQATFIACEGEVGTRENAYFAALETAAGWAIADGALTITTADGGTLVYGAPGDLAGAWTLVAIDGTSVPATVTATAEFGDDGRVSGTAGCNDYSSTYSTEGSTITIELISATFKLCEPEFMDVETPFLDALQNASTWSVVGTTLTIVSTTGSTLQFVSSGTILAPQALPDAVWTLVELDGAAPVPGAQPITATFSPDGQLNGSAGCNEYGGSWTAEGSGLSVPLDSLRKTRKLCDPPEVMAQEGAYLTALSGDSTWSIAGTQLTIINAADAALVFQATAPGPGVEPSPSPSGAPPSPSPRPTLEPPSPRPSDGPSTTDGIVGPLWVMTGLAGTDMTQVQLMLDFETTIQFADDGTVTGSGGCNDYSSTYELVGEALTFGTIDHASFDGCDSSVLALEEAYFQVLGFVDTARLVEGELVLESSLSPATLNATFEEE